MSIRLEIRVVGGHTTSLLGRTLGVFELRHESRCSNHRGHKCDCRHGLRIRNALHDIQINPDGVVSEAIAPKVIDAEVIRIDADFETSRLNA